MLIGCANAKKALAKIKLSARRPLCSPNITAKLNHVEPFAYLEDVLEQTEHPISRL